MNAFRLSQAWSTLSSWQRDFLRAKVVEQLDTRQLATRFGLTAIQVIEIWADMKRHLHPDDRERVDSYLQAYAFLTFDVRWAAFEVLFVGRSIRETALHLGIPLRVANGLFLAAVNYLTESLSIGRGS